MTSVQWRPYSSGAIRPSLMTPDLVDTLATCCGPMASEYAATLSNIKDNIVPLAPSSADEFRVPLATLATINLFTALHAASMSRDVRRTLATLTDADRLRFATILRDEIHSALATSFTLDLHEESFFPSMDQFYAHFTIGLHAMTDEFFADMEGDEPPAIDWSDVGAVTSASIPVCWSPLSFLVHVLPPSFLGLWFWVCQQVECCQQQTPAQ